MIFVEGLKVCPKTFCQKTGVPLYKETPTLHIIAYENVYAPSPIESTKITLYFLLDM